MSSNGKFWEVVDLDFAIIFRAYTEDERDALRDVIVMLNHEVKIKEVNNADQNN